MCSFWCGHWNLQPIICIYYVSCMCSICMHSVKYGAIYWIWCTYITSNNPSHSTPFTYGIRSVKMCVYLKWPKSDVGLPLVKMSVGTAHHCWCVNNFSSYFILFFLQISLPVSYSPGNLTFHQFIITLGNCLYLDVFTRSSSYHSIAFTRRTEISRNP